MPLCDAGDGVVPAAARGDLIVNERNAYRWVSAVDQITGFNNAMAFQGLALVSDGGFPGRDADARAESLLRSWLTPEQREQRINAVGVFTVRGGSTGRRYRLGYGSCYELDEDGQEVGHLCFGPTDFRLPLPDRVLAQKLALECDEETVLRVANRTPQVILQTHLQALAQQQAQVLQNATCAAGASVVLAGLANQQRSAVDPLGLFNVAQTVVGEPCVIDTERVANLVQAAARELQIQERHQRQLRRMGKIACVVWAFAVIVGFACLLQALLN